LIRHGSQQIEPVDALERIGYLLSSDDEPGTHPITVMDNWAW